MSIARLVHWLLLHCLYPGSLSQSRKGQKEAEAPRWLLLFSAHHQLFLPCSVTLPCTVPRASHLGTETITNCELNQHFPPEPLGVGCFVSARRKVTRTHARNDSHGCNSQEQRCTRATSFHVPLCPRESARPTKLPPAPQTLRASFNTQLFLCFKISTQRMDRNGQTNRVHN